VLRHHAQELLSRSCSVRLTKKLVSSEKECHVMVATYPCTRYSPIGDIHGVRTGDDLFQEEPSLTVGLLPVLSARRYSKTGIVCGGKCAGDEEISGRDGSNDKASGLLRACCLSGEIFDLAAAKERPANHNRQPATLRLARACG
jgi:hypothetical protein